MMQSDEHVTTLFRGYANSNTYVWSPFVTKLEFRFRYSHLPYRFEAGSTWNAPSGKVPYVDVSALATQSPEPKQDILADSRLIIQNLVARGVLDDLNKDLTPVQKLTDLSLRALFEERLYFFNMAEKWIDNFYVQRDGVLKSQSFPAKFIIGVLAHRKFAQTLHLQGSGRFSSDEQNAFRREVWETLEETLAERRATAKEDQPFWCLGGDRATEADAAVYAFISTALVAPSSPESAKLIRSLPATMDYATRIHQSHFQDYTKWQE